MYLPCSHLRAFIAIAGTASADTISLAAGDRGRLYDGPGTGGGGEFDAVVQTYTGSSWVATDPDIS